MVDQEGTVGTGYNDTGVYAAARSFDARQASFGVRLGILIRGEEVARTKRRVDVNLGGSDLRSSEVTNHVGVVLDFVEQALRRPRAREVLASGGRAISAALIAPSPPSACICEASTAS